MPLPATISPAKKTNVPQLNNGSLNKLFNEDRPIHDWYRFVLSFPPHLVRDYLEKFEATEGMIALDPFCGTGTMLVESKKLGISTVGIEANPIAHFATSVKLDWSPEPDELLDHAKNIASCFLKKLKAIRKMRTLNEQQMSLLLKNSISPLPLHKSLVLLDEIQANKDNRFYVHEFLALAKSLVFGISNLHFGPEVGVTTPKYDAPVIDIWLANVEAMANDLRKFEGDDSPGSKVYLSDARAISEIIPNKSVDIVITSPPYPNEKDYTRTTRLESIILGFVTSKDELRLLKKGLLRSNTRGIYKGDNDHEWISKFPEIQKIADAIENRRIELGKTSGFEKMYHKVTKLYFGGMAKHLASLRRILRPNAHLAYVVGDQASYLRIMIRTGNLLAKIAEDLGYEVESIDLFRTRLATATKEQLREEVLVLRWPG